MRNIFTAFLLISLLFLQTLEAQRSPKRATPRGAQGATSTSKSAGKFTALSQQHIEKAINLLGIKLGQTLAEARETVEKNGGEIIWLGSRDPNFTESIRNLQRASKIDYFEYAAHSTKNLNKKYVSHTPYSREDVVIKLTVYPKSAGNLKDPNNLIIYKAEISLGFQPSRNEVIYDKVNYVDYTYEDFHAVMEKNNYKLYQNQGAYLSYNKNGAKSLDIGNLKVSGGTWKRDNIRTAPSNKLTSMSAFFPKYAHSLLQTKENGVDQVVTYKPLSEMIDKHEGVGAFQTYLKYGNSVVLTLVQIKSEKDPNIFLLNNIGLSYQDANLMADAYNGFYNALYKE
ncbi:hypothetical protein [Maribacter forsetii]|uniref:hypothetical protein n=1 Tax=Maribacter forsetii TaxID=444515 RepID=UPI00056D4973|nr:hypothetical protein [Maribacter forsetii]